MPAWLQQDWCSSFVLTLGHFLWQGTLIAVVLAMALRTLKSAASRYWVSLTALLLMAACPIVTLGWLVRPLPTTERIAAAPIIPEEFAPSLPADLDAPAAETADVGHVFNVPPPLPLPLPLPAPGVKTTDAAPLPAPVDDRSWWQRFAPQLTTAYLFVVALMFLRLAVGLWGGRRLRRRTTPVTDDTLLAALQRQAKAMGLKLVPVLAYCERVTVPTVVGMLKPMILLPIAVVNSLSPDQVEAVLAHELAHLRRCDHLVNLLQRVIESLLFFHPALWWVSHRIRDEREHCCDDLVVACGAMPLDYAKSLLLVAELSRASELRAGRGSPDPARGSVAAVSLLATGPQKPSHLRQRIARLLGESATPSLRVSPRALLLAIGIPLVALIVTIQSGAGRDRVALPESSKGVADAEDSHALRKASERATQSESPAPALDPTAGLPNSDEDTNPPNNANGDLRSDPASKPQDSKVAYFQTTPSPDDEQRMVEQLRKSLPEDWVVERRFGGYWIDRRRRIFGKHFRETPDVMLHFVKELDVPETPPMEGEVSSESLGPCRFGYCMAAIREDFRREWPAIRQRIQGVLPMGDPATTQSDDDSPTGIAVAGRLLFEDGQPVAGALVGPMFRKKLPLGSDGRFKLRVAPEWSRFRIHMLDANDWPSPRQSPRKAEHKGEVLDVMLPRTEEPFAICHLRLDRTKLHTVKLLWKGESVAARVTVHTYPSGNWLSVGEAPGNGKPKPGGRKPSLNVARTLDVMLRTGETLTIPDVAPGDGTLRIVPIKSRRTLLWNLFGDERDERLEHDPAQTGNVEFRITGAVEAGAQESPLGFMLSRIMPRSGFGLGSMFYNPTEPYRLEFDPKAESYRVSNLQPGLYHVMLMPEGGTSSPPVMFTITTGQTEKIDLPIPKPARSERPKKLDDETNSPNNANGDLRSNPAAGSGDPRRAQQPQSKESRALFQQWQRTARTDGNISGGTLGPLVRVMRNFAKNNPTHEGSPKFAELLKRIEVTRDWSRDEAVKLLDEVAAIYPSLPEWVQGENRFKLGGDVVVGKPLPEELKNAPWGEAQPNGLRVAWLLEPRALKYRLGTPLKSRILFHNAGKISVVFRALTWNQSGNHKAHDADGKEINIVSTEWTTIPMTFACRLAPGEFLEVVGAGIGVGANKDDEDWRDARRDVRVGSWIEAKAGDEVTFSPAAVDAAGREGPHPEGEEAEATPESWWLKFIKDRLSLDAPLPAAADERRRLLDRAVRDLFGNEPTPEEITAFTSDAAPDALDALAQRLANRAGFVPFSGSLKSGTRKFLVLPPDPDAAKKPRSAKGPGQYTLSGATFVVTRRPIKVVDRSAIQRGFAERTTTIPPIGERVVNEAHLSFSQTDTTKPPRKSHPVPLPDGYDSWIAAWMRVGMESQPTGGGTVLWVAQKGVDKKDSIRRYDFTNPESVKETVINELKPSEELPQAILDVLSPTSPRAGRGSPDPALDPTAGLPESDKASNQPNSVNGDLRSNPAAGSGDPRRAQAAVAQPESEALKTKVADLSKLLPKHWHPKLVGERTIEMMPGMYTDSKHRPHVVLVYTDDKTRPAIRWERKDERYEYLGETPHGHGHLFVSMKITGNEVNLASLMELFDWPEAMEFVKAFVKEDRAKVAALKELADNRDLSRDGWGPIKNGIRSRWVPYSDEWVIGKPIFVGLEFLNFDSVSRTFSIRQAHPWRSWEVLGPDGKPVAFRPGKPITSDESYTLKVSSSIVLFHRVDLTQLFDLARPGRYTLRFNGQAVRDVPDELKLDIPADRSLPAAKDFSFSFQITESRDPAADGPEKPESPHEATLKSLDTGPMAECRALIQKWDEAGDTKLAAMARERLAKRWKWITEQPVASFLRELPKPDRDAGPNIRGERIGVQTDLDGVWSEGKGTADNWKDWIVRKQDDYRVGRLHMLFAAAAGYRKVEDAASAKRVLQAGLTGHEIYDADLKTLIRKYWPVTNEPQGASRGSDADTAVKKDAEPAASALPLRDTPEAWTLANYLGELSSAQQALGELDQAFVTHSRLTLAHFMLSWKHPSAGPTKHARELWSLIRQQPQPTAPQFWFNVVDEQHPQRKFDLSSAGQQGQPLTYHHENLAASAPLEFAELTITAKTRGRKGLLDCYRINAEGKHHSLGRLQPTADGETSETLTKTIKVPTGTSLVQFMVAGDDFQVGEVTVAATFKKQTTAAKSSPPVGLDFLKPYPKLHGLSLDMTEPQFLEIVKQQALKTRKTVDGEKVTHHIALGDGHTLIVMFDKDAKCSGIQRIRGEEASDETIALADTVRDFNSENKQLGRGLDQPALTEDEVLTAIKGSDWKRDASDLNEREVATFKEVAESGRLPKGSYLWVRTTDQHETFLVRNYWLIELYLPAIGHDGFVGFPIRHTKLPDEKIDPQQVAWGKPDVDGLSLGIYLSPKKDKYAIGDRVRLRLFVRNEGQKAVKTTWANTSHPMPDAFTVTDQTGAKVAVRIAHESWTLPWISGYVSGGIAAGDAHAFFVPYEIIIGGDGSQNKLIGRVIDARPGQTLNIKVRDSNGNNRVPGKNEPLPESGSITFKVAANAVIPHVSETSDTEADDVAVSWVHRGSVKFGGSDPQVRLVILKDGSAVAPEDHRERESKAKLSQEDVAELLKRLVDDCEIETILGPWFNGKPNLWDGSQDTLFVRRGGKTIRLTCEYGWPSGTDQTDMKIRQFTEASNVLYQFQALIRAGGREAVAKALPIANQGLQQHFPKIERLTLDNFRWGENFPDGHRRLTFLRERRLQGEPENVRVEVLIPDQGESKLGDVTVNDQRVRGEQRRAQAPTAVDEKIRSGLAPGHFGGASQVMRIGPDESISYGTNLGLCQMTLFEDDRLQIAFHNENQIWTDVTMPLMNGAGRSQRATWSVKSDGHTYRATAIPFASRGCVFRLEKRLDDKLVHGSLQFFAVKSWDANATQDEPAAPIDHRKWRVDQSGTGVVAGRYSGASQIMNVAKDGSFSYRDVPLGLCQLAVLDDDRLTASFRNARGIPTEVTLPLVTTAAENRASWSTEVDGHTLRATAVPYSDSVYVFRLEKLSGGKLVEGEQQFYAINQKLRPATPQEQAQAAVDANGEIAGLLLDDVTNKPIAGATITCLLVSRDSGNSRTASSVTDADGRYRLSVPPGVYVVWLNRDASDSTRLATRDEVLVESRQVAKSQLRLGASRKVTGKVLDSNGRPAADLRMKYYSMAGIGPQDLRTSDDGTFEFAVPPGRVQVYALGSGEKSQDNPSGSGPMAEAHFKVSPTAEVAPLTLALKEPDRRNNPSGWLATSTPGTQIVRHVGDQHVTGTVVDESGKPIPGAKLFLFRESMISTNELGEFRVETAKAATLNLHAFAPGYHLWFGTPQSGDVLKIVLEKRSLQTTALGAAGKNVRPVPEIRGTTSSVTERDAAKQSGTPSRPIVNDSVVPGAVLVQLNPPPVVGDFSKVNDPDVLLDQLANGPLQTLMLMTGGGYFHQPGVPLDPTMVRLWEDQYARHDKLDPRERRLIELGPAAVAQVNQRLKMLKATDQLASHLSLVLRSTGTAESIPLLIKLLEPNPKVADAPWLDMHAHTTEFAVTAALWKLTGRKHSLSAGDWKKWWQAVEPDFVVHRDRQNPEFQARVMAARVNALVKELETNEVVAREQLIVLGAAALPHLLTALNVADSLSDAAAARLAWVIDELGATDKLPAPLRRTYFSKRFADASNYIGYLPLEEDAACRALSHCSFADFCSICLAADREIKEQQPLRMRGWMHLNAQVFSRRFHLKPAFVAGDPAQMPLWNQITPAASSAAEIEDAVPVIIEGLKDKVPSVRACATTLADVIGLCSAEQPEPLIVALRDHWLSEPDAHLRLNIGLAMTRFSTPLVLEAISQGLRSERLEIVSDAAGLMGSVKIKLNDNTREDFERLADLTWHDNDRLRYRAVRSLHSKAPALLELHLDRLGTDKSEEIRGECASALRSNPDPRFADLLFLLADDTSEQVRIAALSSIGNMKHPASMKRLLPFLRDKQVHGYAVSALADMGGRDALPLLMTELESGNDVGGMIYQHLRRLSGERFEEQREPWLAWWKKNQPAPKPDASTPTKDSKK